MSFLLTTYVIIGALAWRGGAGVVEMDKEIESAQPLFLLKHKTFVALAYLYLILAIITGVFNGYILLDLKGLIVLPVVTWIAFQGIDILISLNRTARESLLFNPIPHLILFAPIYLILTGWSTWTLITR